MQLLHTEARELVVTYSFGRPRRRQRTLSPLAIFPAEKAQMGNQSVLSLSH